MKSEYTSRQTSLYDYTLEADVTALHLVFVWLLFLCTLAVGQYTLYQGYGSSTHSGVHSELDLNAG